MITMTYCSLLITLMQPILQSYYIPIIEIFMRGTFDKVVLTNGGIHVVESLRRKAVCEIPHVSLQGLLVSVIQMHFRSLYIFNISG